MFLQSKEEDTQIDKGRLKYGDTVCFSRITDCTLETHLSVDSNSKCMILVCGTRSFDEDMISLLNSHGFDQTKYFKF